MSLLDRGTDLVTVFPEEAVADSDGNTRTRPAATGVVTRASLHPLGGTDEDHHVGFGAIARYRLRLPRGFPVLGAQSEIEWRENRWVLEGDPVHFNGLKPYRSR